MHTKPFSVLSRTLLLLLILFPTGLFAQKLGKVISVKAVRKPLDTVLARISEQGNCSFSYAGKPFRGDSIVTITIQQKTVRQSLDLLFQGRMQYQESGQHIIIQRAEAVREKHYVISGYIRDRESGQGIVNASIYDRTDLNSTFTNIDGYFHLRLKDKGRQPSVQLMISKELYLDTALYIMPGFDREISIAIAPAKAVQLREFTVSDEVEKTWFGKRLLGEGLQRQTENISRFFTTQPVQTSIVPSLGTHGKMAGQVVNKFSLNLLGGYAAGLNGVEVAGGFNINKKDVQYVQVAGIFNIVGGEVKGAQAAGIFNQNIKSVSGAQAAGITNLTGESVTGVQLAGLINNVGDSLNGAQAAGIYNHVGGHVKGIQLTGLINRADSSVRGAQAAGLINLDKGTVSGIQLAGLINHAGQQAQGIQIAGGINNTQGHFHGIQLSGVGNRTNGNMRGLQLGPVFNYARNLKGVQIGIVNIADTSSGTSIGLINIVKHNGYHQFSLFTSDLMPYNFSFKSGTRRFYVIISAGTDKDIISAGLGIGREFRFGKRLAVTTDLLQQSLFSTDWKSMGEVYRLTPMVHYKFTRWLSVQAGPAFSYAEFEKDIIRVPGKGYPGFTSEGKYTGWLGWQAGISLF